MMEGMLCFHSSLLSRGPLPCLLPHTPLYSGAPRISGLRSRRGLARPLTREEYRTAGQRVDCYECSLTAQDAVAALYAAVVDFPS